MKIPSFDIRVTPNNQQAMSTTTYKSQQVSQNALLTRCGKVAGHWSHL